MEYSAHESTDRVVSSQGDGGGAAAPADGLHAAHLAPPPVNMYLSAGATAYGSPQSFVPVAAPPAGAPPQAADVGTLPPAVELGATWGGAVGQAVAVPQLRTLSGAATRDSVSNHGTQAAELQMPAANAPV